MSRHFRPLPASRVQLSDRFWRPWQERMAGQGLPHQWRECERTGRIENLRRCARGESGGYQGYRFNDSDVYKLLEASAYATGLGLGGPVEGWVGEAIDLIAAAQGDDGYINSYVALTCPDMRWCATNSSHESYCIGHLIEAAVAHSAATRKDRLLDVATRSAEHLLREFGPEGQLGYPGHQEIELALVRLAHATGRSEFTMLAARFVQSRGSRPSPFETELQDPEVVALSPGSKPLFYKDGEYDGAYAQDDVPLVHQSRAVGHAVRAMYYYCGAVDSLGDDEPTMAALSRIWDSLVGRQMYVTGGIGSSGRNEGFGDDFDLPNLEAYAETCAGIGLVFWAWRMFLATGDGRHLDVLERALYNAVLSGVSEDCTAYFYDNPLESDGRHVRKPWFDCACCPPNIARLVLSIGQYAVAESERSVAVCLPLSGVYSCGAATISVEGSYPWSGDYTVQVQSADGLETIALRIPEWADGVELRANGDLIVAEPNRGLVTVRRAWAEGDTIEVRCAMSPRWVVAHDRVLSCAGRAALQHGPLVYCLEEHDLGFAPQHWAADTAAPIGTAKPHGRIEVQGSDRRRPDSALYRQIGDEAPRPKEAEFVPYHTWANRGPNSMLVWVRTG